MKILLINSGNKNAFAAVLSDDTSSVVYASEFIDTTGTNSKTPDKLINCLEKLSHESKLNDADAIAITIGPGSFTGIRVGLSLAKGMAFGMDKKLIAINNFDLTLNRLNDISPDKRYCVIIEAKLPEYYYAIYLNGIIEQKGSETLENLQKSLQNDTIIVGDFGDETLIKHCYFKYINVKNHKSELSSMSWIAQNEFRSGNLSDAGKVLPLYLKEFNFKKP